MSPFSEALIAHDEGAMSPRLGAERAFDRMTVDRPGVGRIIGAPLSYDAASVAIWESNTRLLIARSLSGRPNKLVWC